MIENTSPKYSLQITFLTLREMFKILDSATPKNSDINNLYKYLNVSAHTYQKFLQSESETIPDSITGYVIPQLLKCGFSYDLLVNANCVNDSDMPENILRMSSELTDLTEDYLSSIKEKRTDDNNFGDNHVLTEENLQSRQEYREMLRDEMYNICNPDGSLFIDDVSALYDAIYTNKDKIDFIKKFIAENTDKKLPDSYLQKEVRNFIKSDVIEYTQNIPDSTDIINADNPIKAKKNHAKKANDFIVPSSPADKIAVNLLLIHELYYQFIYLEQVDIPKALNDFYIYLGETEKSYTTKTTGKNVYIETIREKLKPFGFSPKIFRTDAPTLLPMGNSLKKIILDYFNSSTKNISDLRDKLTTEILYIMDAENAPVIYSIYKLREAIKKESTQN